MPSRLRFFLEPSDTVADLASLGFRHPAPQSHGAPNASVRSNAMHPSDLHAMHVRFHATDDLRLPCLPTIALRGVLGMTLHHLSCVNRVAKTCAHCAAAPSCAYSVLLEPAGKEIPDLGVTDRAPSPIVLAPGPSVLDGNPLELRKGERLDVRVVLLGPARPLADLVVAALRVGARGGVGKPSYDGSRVPLTVVDVRVEPVVYASPSTAAILETISPLRLTHEGKVRARFGAREFLLALARRIDTVSRLYGSEPLGPEPSTDGLTLESRAARVVHVKRWSARQKARMDLPGVIGTFELRGDVEPWWPWLALGEWVQVGKGTSMGFGRYRLWGASRDQTPRTPTDP